MFAPIELADDVVLREIRESDAPALLQAYLKNRDYLAPWEPERPASFFTLVNIRAMIQDDVYHEAVGDRVPLIFQWGEAIGGILTLEHIVRDAWQSGELSFWLDPELSGRGLMTKSVTALTEHALSVLALHRIVAGTLPHNANSQNVLRRCGYTQFGVAQDYLKIAGAWQDHIMFERVGAESENV